MLSKTVLGFLNSFLLAALGGDVCMVALPIFGFGAQCINQRLFPKEHPRLHIDGIRPAFGQRLPVPKRNGCQGRGRRMAELSTHTHCLAVKTHPLCWATLLSGAGQLPATVKWHLRASYRQLGCSRTNPKEDPHFRLVTKTGRKQSSGFARAMRHRRG